MTEQAHETGATDAFEHRWRVSPALVAAIALAVAFAAIGLVLSRPDLAVCALPFVGTAVAAWARRPDRVARSAVVIELDETPHDEHGSRRLRFGITFRTDPHAEAVQLRCTAQGIDRSRVTLQTRRSGPGGREASDSDGREASGFGGSIPVLHSGPHEFLRVDYRLTAADASFVSEPTRPVHVNRVVPAPFTPIASLPLPHRLQSLTGAHDSARPGDGGEFRDVHPFHTGDRLRRIDWKATARLARNPGDLYVRRTAATADAIVFVVLDSTNDVGESVADWPSSTPTLTGVTSMDLARRAASSIAAGYVKVGDQVAFQDLTATGRAISQGSGTRHLQRLLRAIAMTEATGRPFARHRAPIITPGAMVYLISPFLDEEPARMASLWRGSGHRVIAVDVLPLPRLDRLTREQLAAHRMVSMERADRLRELTASGVEVMRFADDEVPGSRDARLRELARPGRGRR